MPTNTLQYWRVKRGNNITELARKADVSTRLITKIESDEHYIAKADTMEQLALQGLGLPVFVVFFPKEYEMVREAIYKMIQKQMYMMSPDGLFNMSRLGLDALVNDPSLFVQRENTQSCSPVGASPASAPRL